MGGSWLRALVCRSLQHLWVHLGGRLELSGRGLELPPAAPLLLHLLVPLGRGLQLPPVVPLLLGLLWLPLVATLPPVSWEVEPCLAHPHEPASRAGSPKGRLGLPGATAPSPGQTP